MPILFVQGVSALSYPWWGLALRGVAALLFAALTFFMPGASIAALVLVFGAYALIDGIFSLIAGFRTQRSEGSHWPLWLIGVTGILAGVLTFFYPGVTAFTLVFIVAAWSIWSGIFHIASAIRLRKYITGEWLIGITGALQIAFGVMLMARPGIGAFVLVLWLGAFAFALGVLLLIAAFRLRGLQHRTHDGSSGVWRHA